MLPSRVSLRRSSRQISKYTSQRRGLLTLAIETSCDDTSVAVLEKHKDSSATLHFHAKVTSDNRKYGGIYPIAAHEGHQKSLAGLVKAALQNLPRVEQEKADADTTIYVKDMDGGHNVLRKKPDFVTATRGPGMRAGLITGVDTAKGLAVAWQVPFLGVNHMQAHALTPRLISALDGDEERMPGGKLNFPFLTLLVSGGHTMLVHSKTLCDHKILSNTVDLAIGDMLDKCGRDILPKDMIASADDVMYARLLEKFAFPEKYPDYKHEVAYNTGFREQYESEWVINPPYLSPGPGGPEAHMNKFSMAGIGSSTRRIVEMRPEMKENELRCVTKEAMRIAFHHLSSRIIYALYDPDLQDVKTLVVSGGVACNKYLKYVLRKELDKSGNRRIGLNFPPPEFCTDNAAMIAWTGIEMYEAGWRTDLDATAINKWSIDPEADDGGILGLGGWIEVGDDDCANNL